MIDLIAIGFGNEPTAYFLIFVVLYPPILFIAMEVIDALINRKKR